MPLPLAVVATGFIGSIAAAITQFALTKVGHAVAALGLTMIAYKGMDVVFDTLIDTFGVNLTAIQSVTISANGSTPIPAGQILMDMMGLIGLWEAANVIFSAAISAYSLKQAVWTLKRLTGTN